MYPKELLEQVFEVSVCPDEGLSKGDRKEGERLKKGVSICLKYLDKAEAQLWIGVTSPHIFYDIKRQLKMR